MSDNYVPKQMLEELISAKDGEVQSLKDEVKYLKEKIDQLMGMVGKK
jgi:peptidoglycan hydrolase CwlO-like protein